MGISKLIMIIFPAGLIVSGCSSLHVFDVPSTQKTLSDSLHKSDEVLQKVQLDLNEKRMLLENLKRGNAKGYQENEHNLLAIFSDMQAALNELSVQHKKLLSTNSDIASLTYNKKTLRSGEPGFEQLNSAIQQFKTATNASNRNMETYSQKSNSMTEMIEKRRLLLSLEPRDFVTRVQKTIKQAQEVSEEMLTEVNRNKQGIDNRNSNGTSTKDLEKVNAKLLTQAELYHHKAERYAEIAKEMNELTANGRVTSLDPEWPRVQKLMNEYDYLIVELSNMNGQFKDLAKRLRQESMREQ